MKIYFASKLRHAPAWQGWKGRPDVEVVSRWIDMLEETDMEKIAVARAEDVAACDRLILYTGMDDILRGALIEFGIALALGKEIVMVGQIGLYKSAFHHHPRVRRAISVREAVKLESW